MPVRPKRFLDPKTCDRCFEEKKADDFPKTRGGGTADICKECKRVAVSDAMIAHHRKGIVGVFKAQDEHFAASLRREQERWDSLPDGHPYKAPRRPGSEPTN